MRLQEWREKSNTETQEEYGTVDGYYLEQDEASDSEEDSKRRGKGSKLQKPEEDLVKSASTRCMLHIP
jgi:hypothetical protein